MSHFPWSGPIVSFPHARFPPFGYLGKFTVRSWGDTVLLYFELEVFELVMQFSAPTEKPSVDLSHLLKMPFPV